LREAIKVGSGHQYTSVLKADELSIISPSLVVHDLQFIGPEWLTVRRQEDAPLED
jgi:hypothetical protein